MCRGPCFPASSLEQSLGPGGLSLAVGPQAHVPGHVDPQVLVVGPVVLRRQDDPNVMTLPDTAERHEQSAYLVALLNREINVDPVECQALALVDGLPNPNRAAR